MEVKLCTMRFALLMVEAQWGRPKEEGRRYEGTRVNSGVCEVPELLEFDMDSLIFDFLK